MKFSTYFLPTTREEPAEAEVISHKLMLRSGMIRRLAAGVYSLMPFGLRAIQKLEMIIREEMNKAGAQELFLPALQPAELWQKSGRWELYGKELMRLTDRHERKFCLGPTHEEVITKLVANEVRSYRQLPLNLYQIQTKYRDEIRPRFGVMRGREFSMKDAYSFDRDEKGAEESYAIMFEAYKAIFARCGLEFKPVEADSGPIGGSFSHEFVVLAATGEDAIINCSACGYGANLEKAESPAPVESSPEDERLLEVVETPGVKSVEGVSSFLKISPSSLVKTLIYRVDDQYAAVLLQGNHQLNEIKLGNFLKAANLAPASPAEIEDLTGAPVGYSGPVGLKGAMILADQHIMQRRNFVTGANKKDAHLINVNHGRDFSVDEVADFKLVESQDPCPRCGQPLVFTRGIEVGHVFKLGTKYSEAMGAHFLDEEGCEKAMIMGCYGIGVGRTIAACIEQNHDEKGIIWPLSLAPFDMTIITLNIQDKETMETSEKIYRGLVKKGWNILWDERDERPGVKFKDADLIGLPLRVTVGPRSLKNKEVEVERRRNGERIHIQIDDAVSKIDGILASLKSPLN